MIFGGWNAGHSKDVMILMEKASNVLSIKRFKDKSGNLADGDNFLLNGVAVQDPVAKELLIPGQDFIHACSLSSHKFRTVRRIYEEPKTSRD